MVNVQSRACVFALAVGVALAVQSVRAVDVKVDFEKTFDFKSARTWGWKAAGPGEIKMARTPDDDPEAMQKAAEPVIVDAVTSEMARRGLTFTTAAPDVFVTYFVLLTSSVSAQTVGQFLPATAQWGIPPFLPSTSSMEVMNQGALVLDVSAQDKIVWRGVAQAKIQIGSERKKREALIREAVRDLLRRYPSRS